MIAPLLIGVAFGVALQKARLGRYETIVNVFRFTDLTVVKFLLTALAVGMLATQLLALAGFARPPIPPTYLHGQLLGGLLFGAGMALAGFCPGTVAAGAGEGRLDYLIAGSFGLWSGALLFGFAWPRFYPALSALGRMGSVTLADALSVSPLLLALVVAEVFAFVLYLIERRMRRCASSPSSPPAPARR